MSLSTTGSSTTYQIISLGCCAITVLNIDEVKPFCDSRDLAYVEDYLKPFRRYDAGTKSTRNLPPMGILAGYEYLIRTRFPKPILF
jgi:hypothetical protein